MSNHRHSQKYARGILLCALAFFPIAFFVKRQGVKRPRKNRTVRKNKPGNINWFFAALIAFSFYKQNRKESRPQVQKRRRKKAVVFSVVVLLVIFIIHQFGRSINWALRDDYPHALILMSPSTDHTLYVAPELSLFWFMTIGVLRRFIADPFWYYLGSQRTDGMRHFKQNPKNRRERFLHWLTKTVGEFIKRVDTTLGRSDRKILVWSFFSSGMDANYLLGRRGVSLKKVIPINVTGTVLQVYLMYLLGEQLEPFLAIQSFIMTIVALSIGLTVFWKVASKRYLRYYVNRVIYRMEEGAKT